MGCPRLERLDGAALRAGNLHRSVSPVEFGDEIEPCGALPMHKYAVIAVVVQEEIVGLVDRHDATADVAFVTHAHGFAGRGEIPISADFVCPAFRVVARRTDARRSPYH